MSKQRKPKPKSRSSVKVNHPPASDPTLTRSSMPFHATPYTTANAEPVRPLTTPKLRQLVAGGAVTIIGKDGL